MAQTALPSLSDPAISPDGREIAFVSGGDIWTVAAAGGEAGSKAVHGEVARASVPGGGDIGSISPLAELRRAALATFAPLVGSDLRPAGFRSVNGRLSKRESGIRDFAFPPDPGVLSPPS